jgi:hypothetical protein
MKPTLEKMPKLTRYEQQQAARDQKKLNFEKLRKIGSKSSAAATPKASAPTAKEAIQPVPPPVQQTALKAGDSGLKYYSRAEGAQQMHAQPWASAMVSTLLKASTSGGVHLCLAWPVKLDSLALLHGLASMERNFDTDLRGLRTLLFPGLSTGCTTALQSVLVNRKQMSDKYRTLWSGPTGNLKLESKRRSASFEAVWAALNDIRNWQAELPNPSLGELIPTFSFDAQKRQWCSVVKSPLERSLSKVTKLAHRKELRGKVNSEWGAGEKAPGALMTLHPNSRKDVWKHALASPQLKGEARPDVLLLDATSTTERRYYNAVRKIPEFLRFAKDNGLAKQGAVVVTDDPKTFFVMRARLEEMHLAPVSQVWAAESEHALMSATPLPAGWTPEQKTNANFAVTIVDRDASSVALKFQRLAHEVPDESLASKALMAICMYVLWLSNLPVGFKDLTDDFNETEGEDFAKQRSAWSPLVLDVKAALQSGALNNVRAEVDAALVKANSLIDSWNDATPMALRLLAEVKKHTKHLHGGLSLVLPNQKSIRLAHRFLQRKLGADLERVQEHLEWHTLSSTGAMLDVVRPNWGMIFIGINGTVLRLLLAHPKIPHGTAILVAYRQAQSTVVTLKSMQGLDAFQRYRGRIGLLTQELERRLKEVPNALNIDRLAETSFNFNFLDTTNTSSAAQQGYFKFDLESGQRAYSSGWMYRYCPDEDPCFRRAGASTIVPGDNIFVMSDELRGQIEALLGLNSPSINSRVNPARALLKLYHEDVKLRCELFFKSKPRAALAREIHSKMLELDPYASGCTPQRLEYWLALNESDARPHAAQDSRFFKIFCRALQIDDASAEQHLAFVRKARAMSQHLGRELAARYSEVIFAPESAMTYRKVPPETIQKLQQEALRCVDCVVGVTPPVAATH